MTAVSGLELGAVGAVRFGEILGIGERYARTADTPGGLTVTDGICPLLLFHNTGTAISRSVCMFQNHIAQGIDHSQMEKNQGVCPLRP